MAVRFSPEILGLNTRIFGIVSGSSGLIFGLLLVRVCYFYVLLLKKMDNMWSYGNHVNICLLMY